MLVSVIAIGNSKGIRLPKAILDQLNIVDTLELKVENKQIILKPIVTVPRKDWDSAFMQMQKNEEDELLMNSSLNSEAFEWEW